MSSAGRNSISSCFQHGLQDGYLSLKPHVKGGLFPLTTGSRSNGLVNFIHYTRCVQNVVISKTIFEIGDPYRQQCILSPGTRGQLAPETAGCTALSARAGTVPSVWLDFFLTKFPNSNYLWLSEFPRKWRFSKAIIAFCEKGNFCTPGGHKFNASQAMTEVVS